MLDSDFTCAYRRMLRRYHQPILNRCARPLWHGSLAGGADVRSSLGIDAGSSNWIGSLLSKTAVLLISLNEMEFKDERSKC